MSKYDDIQQAIQNQETFNYDGASSVYIASPVDIELNRGKAEDAAVAELQQAMEGQSKGYLVFSYSTPIALFTPAAVTVPEAKYSSTTSRLQNLCRRFQ